MVNVDVAVLTNKVVRKDFGNSRGYQASPSTAIGLEPGPGHGLSQVGENTKLGFGRTSMSAISKNFKYNN